MEEMIREPIQSNLMKMADELNLSEEMRSNMMQMASENLSRCQCGECPTYQKSKAQETNETFLYCSPARRQSEEISPQDRENCNCPGCPVFLEEPTFHLSYYCIVGAAPEKTEQIKQMLADYKRMQEAA